MLRFLGWLLNLIRPFPTDEYWNRFLKPAWERGQALGIPDRVLQSMWSEAWNNAEPQVIGRAPVALFNRMIDAWEENRVRNDDVS